MGCDIQRSKILNKYKDLIEIGDIAIHEKYGIGTVEEISLDDCLRPIHVRFFPKCDNPWHQGSGYNTWYDCTGEAEGPENTVKFYKRLDLENKENDR